MNYKKIARFKELQTIINQTSKKKLAKINILTFFRKIYFPNHHKTHARCQKSIPPNTSGNGTNHFPRVPTQPQYVCTRNHQVRGQITVRRAGTIRIHRAKKGVA